MKDPIKDPFDEKFLEDIDVSLLLDIDLSSAVDHEFSFSITQYSSSVLRLEDLDNIDWDLVSSSVLGITDPIGQLKDWLASVLQSFIDTIKKAYESIAKPISDTVSTILNIVSGIPGALSRLADIINSVVITPIRDVLNWIASTLPSLQNIVYMLFSTIWDNITKIPGAVADILRGVGEKASSLLKDVASGLSTLASQISDAITRGLSTLGDMVRSVSTVVTSVFSDLADKIKSGFSWFIDQIVKIPDLVRNLVDKVVSTFSDLADKIRGGLSWFIDQVSKTPDLIKDLVSRVTSIFSDLADKIKSGFSWFIEQVAKLPDVIRSFIDTASKIFGDLADRIKGGFSWFIDQVAKIPDMVRSFIDMVTKFFGDLVEKIRGGLSWFIDHVVKLPDVIRDLADKTVKTFTDLAEKIGGGFKWFIDTVAKLPEIASKVASEIVKALTGAFEELTKRVTKFSEDLGKALTDVGDKIKGFIGDVEKGVGGLAELITTKFDEFTRSLRSFSEGAREWFENATNVIKQVGAAFMGFTNALLNLPGLLGKEFERLKNFFETIYNEIQEFIKDPLDYIKKKILKPIVEALSFLGEKIYEGVKAFGELIYKGLSWIWDRLVEGANWIKDRIIDLSKKISEGIFGMIQGVKDWAKTFILKWFRSGSPFIYIPALETADEVEKIFQEALRKERGVAENLWIVGGSLAYPFWELTIIPLLLRGIVGTFGDYSLTIEPEVAGSKAGGIRFSIKVKEFIDAYVRGLETYFTGYALGSSMAIANMFMVNLQQLYIPRVVSYYDKKIRDIIGDLFPKDVLDKAKINMFLKPLTETELFEYGRRSLVLAYDPITRTLKTEELEKILSTIKVYLTIYGLPKWYIDFITSKPEVLSVEFIDRFGVSRKIFISPLFELPTHSELARMTQRDIFPGVDVMKQVGWIRGWNEDLTTMTYLLTFKYPSFEKLWQFYMRALAGMLWFKAPDTIKYVFDREAEEVKAGKPISPLDIQKAIQGPDQLKAFETALNTYFKWIEYSNFSWFTENTTMYEINIGREIISKLGGWTADSWLMIDVAADIPTKIDMRWMSRYGIFQMMGERFDKLGVKFESYSPMVEIVPKLMDTSPATPIQVDLRWFSKLLQATGLHPAWIPVTTVAENIMVISDEMTLLRTGWLNLFKEGLITVDDAEKYLAGLLTVSYLVGYWDPEKKVWTSGWINLPVRWMPHERRLLQLRMAIDRVMDVFREIYGYIKSGIRTLAISVDDAKERLKTLVSVLDAHYRELTKKITGVEMSINIDEKYMTLWIELQKLAQDIEAKERIRAWWMRVSGWILYRVAYGYVSVDDLKKFMDVISKYAYMSDIEVNAYKELVEALMSVIKKESIPSPSTLATFSEYLDVDPKVIDDVLTRYNVPEEYKDLWRKYISMKPIKSDFKTVLTTMLKAVRYGVVSKDDYEKMIKIASEYGFTSREISLIQMKSELELLIDEAKSWRPTLMTLIGMTEYVPEAVELMKYYRVDPLFRQIVEKYAKIKPLADEIRILVNALYRAKRYISIPKELEDKIISIVKAYGVTDEELTIRDLVLELETLVDENKIWLPTPSVLATLSEYVNIPAELIMETLAKRRVPSEWISIWIRYITVKPVKSDYKAVINTALKGFRLGVIDEKMFNEILSKAKEYGFIDREIDIIKMRADLELLIESAREYIPTPSQLVAMSEYIPEVRNYIDQVLKARRITGVWAYIWAKYIYLRPVVDEVRRYANVMFRLAQEFIIDMKQLDPVFETLRTYGYEDLEKIIIQKTISAEQMRIAFNNVLGSPRALAGMSRYTDKAVDLAYTRVVKMIDVLPVDQATKDLLKQMWREYITTYQTSAEIRTYMNEIINAYAYGVLDKTGLENELNNLRKMGVPELRISLVRRTAELRRARIIAR